MQITPLLARPEVEQKARLVLNDLGWPKVVRMRALDRSIELDGGEK